MSREVVAAWLGGHAVAPRTPTSRCVSAGTCGWRPADAGRVTTARGVQLDRGPSTITVGDGIPALEDIARDDLGLRGALGVSGRPDQ